MSGTGADSSQRLAEERERNWKLKLALKEKCIEDLTDKLSAAERLSKRLEFEKKEYEEAVERKCILLEEENKLLRIKFEEIMIAFDRSQELSIDPKSKYQSVEARYNQAMDLAKITGSKLEETEFTVEQFKLTNEALKREVLSLNDMLKNTREANCQLEIELVEHKEKLASMNMQLKSLHALQNKTNQEILLALETIKKNEEDLMTEKKKCAELERIKEELAFTAHNNERNLSDQIKSLKLKHEKLIDDFTSSKTNAEHTNERLRTALNTEVQNMNTMARKMKLLEDDNKEKGIEIYKLKNQLDIMNSRIGKNPNENLLHKENSRLNRVAIKLKEELIELKEELKFLQTEMRSNLKRQIKSSMNDMRDFTSYLAHKLLSFSKLRSSSNLPPKHEVGESRRRSIGLQNYQMPESKRDLGFYDESSMRASNYKDLDRYDISLHPMNETVVSSSSLLERRSRGNDIRDLDQLSSHKRTARPPTGSYIKIEKTPQRQDRPPLEGFRTPGEERTITKQSGRGEVSRAQFDLQAIELESLQISKRIADLKRFK